MDACHVLGTVHLYKYRSRVPFLPTSGECDVSGESPVFVYVDLLRSHNSFVFDKQTGESCVKWPSARVLAKQSQ